VCASGIRQLNMTGRSVRCHPGYCKVTSPQISIYLSISLSLSLSGHSGKSTRAFLPAAHTHAGTQARMSHRRGMTHECCADKVEMQRDWCHIFVKGTTSGELDMRGGCGDKGTHPVVVKSGPSPCTTCLSAAMAACG
jgi:hypothetical protein